MRLRTIWIISKGVSRREGDSYNADEAVKFARSAREAKLIRLPGSRNRLALEDFVQAAARSESGRTHRDWVITVNHSDLTVVAGMSRQKDAYTCLITGRPCQPVPVLLRRMFVFPPVWVGSESVILLPLEKAPSLARWQYLRMLRPWIGFFGMVIVSFGSLEAFNLTPGTTGAMVATSVSLFVAVALWFILGRLLDRYEFVRLLRSHRRSGTVTVRFANEDLARRAAENLVCPAGKDP